MSAPELFYSVVTACIFFFLNGSTFKSVDYKWLCVTNLLDTII